MSSLKRSFSAPFNKGKEEEMMDKDEIMDTKLHTGTLFMSMSMFLGLNDQRCNFYFFS